MHVHTYFGLDEGLGEDAAEDSPKLLRRRMGFCIVMRSSVVVWCWRILDVTVKRSVAQSASVTQILGGYGSPLNVRFGIHRVTQEMVRAQGQALQ